LILNKRIKLNVKEKGVLLFEGIGTFLLFQIINLILIGAVGKNSFVENIKTNLSNLFSEKLWILVLVLLIQLILAVMMSLTMYHRFELHQVQQILQSSATTNLPKPIEVKVNQNLQGIIDNYNLLISNMNRRSKEQEQSEKSKDELISNVSHDIRTPLTSVIGYLGLIESKNYSDLGQILKYTHIAYKKIFGNAKFGQFVI
jgi:Signal transduction histidine kinase